MRKILLIVALIMLTSCSKQTLYGTSDLGTYGNTVPKEQMAILVITHSSRVTHFDGKEVEWKAPWPMPEAFIRIPAGTHQVKYTYERTSGGGGPPREAIRNNQRVTVMTVTPRYEEKYDRDVTVDFERDKIYLLDKETITIYNGRGRNFYKEWK